MNRLQVTLYVVIVIATFIVGIVCGIEWGYVKRDEEYEEAEEKKAIEQDKFIF